MPTSSQGASPALRSRPVLFSGPMIRALLDGRKTQTRRAVRNVDTEEHPYVGTFDERDGLPVIVFSDAPGDAVLSRVEAKCPYGKPGDLLWVRETWCQGHERDADLNFVPDGDGYKSTVWYRAATPELRWYDDYERETNVPWRPSIHMPRWASRLTLEVTGVRVERLQEISADDCRAEGALLAEAIYWPTAAVSTYRDLWQSINGPESWDANPWVWVLEFKVHRCNVDAMPRHEAA